MVSLWALSLSLLCLVISLALVVWFPLPPLVVVHFLHEMLMLLTMTMEVVVVHVISSSSSSA